MIEVCNNLARSSIQIGFACAEVGGFSDADILSGHLAEFCERLESEKSLLETRRLAARDMLRNGKFKPTGRSKPANEYLLRTVSEQGPSGFPRVNPVVDVANFISLSNQTPLSLWDRDRVEATTYLFRYGSADESYVFNSGGQTISLRDLAVGCSSRPGDQEGNPIVNPVKDCLATKTDESSRRFGIAVYASKRVFSSSAVASLLSELLLLLEEVTTGLRHGTVVVQPGSSAFLQDNLGLVKDPE